MVKNRNEDSNQGANKIKWFTTLKKGFAKLKEGFITLKEYIPLSDVYLTNPQFWYTIINILLFSVILIFLNLFEWDWLLIGKIVFIAFFLTPPSLLNAFRGVYRLSVDAEYWEKIKSDSNDTKDFDLTNKILKTTQSVLAIIALLIAGGATLFSPSFYDFINKREVLVHGTVLNDNEDILDLSNTFVEMTLLDKSNQILGINGERGEDIRKIQRFIPIKNGYFESKYSFPKYVESVIFSIKSSEYKEVEGTLKNNAIVYKGSVYKDIVLEEKNTLKIDIQEDTLIKLGDIKVDLLAGDKVYVYKN